MLPRSCRVFVAIAPANEWGWSEIMANKTNYLLELLVWTKTKDAQKRAPSHKPKPFVPDFMKAPVEPSAINEGSQSMTVDDIKSWIALPRGV